jgi:hypothetical protein
LVGRASVFEVQLAVYHFYAELRIGRQLVESGLVGKLQQHPLLEKCGLLHLREQGVRMGVRMGVGEVRGRERGEHGRLLG